MSPCAVPLLAEDVEGQSPLRGAQGFRPLDRGLIPCRGAQQSTCGSAQARG